MEKGYLYKDVNSYSEEVQEIMGRVPHWILRCGIALIFFVILVLLVGSYFFRYPEKVTTEVHILPVVPPARIAAKAKGNFRDVFVHNGDTVQKGQILAIIEYVTKEGFLGDSVFSPIDGVINTTLLCESGTLVNSDDTFFTIMSVQRGDIQAYGMLTVPEKEKVKRDMRVVVRMTNNGDDEVVDGVVRSVSEIPNIEDRYFFDVAFPTAMYAQYGEATVSAEIIVKDKRLLECFLQPVASYFKQK